MKVFAFVTLAWAFAAATGPASAMDHMMVSGSLGAHMAACARSNPAVIVNTTKMTYMLDTVANRTAMRGMMDHDKFVCKSTATRMGAKMRPSTMMAHPGKM